MFCKSGHRWDYYSNIIPNNFKGNRADIAKYYRFLHDYVWYTRGGYGRRRSKIKIRHSAYYKKKEELRNKWRDCAMNYLLEPEKIDENCPKVYYRWAPSWHSLEKIQRKHLK